MMSKYVKLNTSVIKRKLSKMTKMAYNVFCCEGVHMFSFVCWFVNFCSPISPTKSPTKCLAECATTDIRGENTYLFERKVFWFLFYFIFVVI